MGKKRKYSGFSLAEVLLAIGTLAIGMIFIGGTFLVGIHFTTVSTERTTASIAAGEAFAKVKLYGGVNTAWLSALSPIACVDFNDVVVLNPNEFAYPSTRTDPTNKQYFWSALCKLDPNDLTGRSVQVTVFVSRKIGAATMYEGPAGPIDRPVAMPVGVSGVIDDPVLTITGDASWIGTGYTIVEESTGEIFRVVGQGPGPQVALDPDKPWRWNGAGVVWVVPPPLTGGRGPCIAVYQTVIRF